MPTIARVLGEFLHHSPSDGSAEDGEELRQAFARTAKFYVDVFGETYSAADAEGAPANWLKFFE